MSPVSKYLKLYAESEARTIDLAPFEGDYDCAVVIPCLRERDLLGGCLTALERSAVESNARTLAIIVVNNRANHPETWKADNWATLNDLAQRQSGTTALRLLVVDRASPGRELPEKTGVGLARKVGCDIAVRLWAEGRLHSNWIRTTDADARVANDYLAPIATESIAVHYPFFHHSDSSDPAVQMYDGFLRYYVAGLRFAESPYAFPTIGSCLAFRVEPYAAVRGFPRGEAGEDFYLLNKLRKAGQVEMLDREPITLQTRGEVRVPFGTTRSQTTIRNLLDSGEGYRVYHPNIFRELRDLEQALNRFSISRDIPQFRNALSAGSLSAWEEMGGTIALCEAARQRKTEGDLRRHLQEWFDGFRTLKWIHRMNGTVYPKVAWSSTLIESFTPSLDSSLAERGEAAR